MKKANTLHNPEIDFRRARQTVFNAAFWLAFAACVANALLFTYSAATPLPANDSWFFLETFVDEYYRHALDFKDFFNKRSIDDHAQPLQKLILLWHLRHFDLDFKIEAMVGVLFAAIGALTAVFYARRHQGGAEDNGVLSAAGYWLCIILIPVLCLSISASQIFTWSLVTLGFVLLPCAIVFFHLTGAAVTKTAPAWTLVPAAFVLAVVLDNLAIIYVLASICVCLIVAVSKREFKDAAKVALFAAAGCLLYDGLVQPILTPDDLPAGAGSSGLSYAMAHWQSSWKLIWNPLRLIVVPPEQLEGSPGTFLYVAMALGIALLSLHALFWFRFFKSLPNADGFDLANAGLMIGFYGTVAAIAAGRLSINGYDYLLQPRYYVAYLLGILPILAVGARTFVAERTLFVDRVYGALLIPFALSMIVAQAPMTMKSWERYKYISEYTQVAALQMGQLRENPEQTNQCADILYVCGYDTARKRKLVGILSRNELNIFNRAFQLRYRLYPREEDAPGK
jgi:hypothetical protein